MRTWTKSACVVLAWSILPVVLTAAGMKGSVHPAQANTRTTSSTESILTSIQRAAAPPAPAAPAAPAVTGSSPATMYVVQPGDTLSGIAARFDIQGGWPPLYTSNLKAIGWNPNVLHPGTALVLPGPARVRYTVSAGDTLSGIAAGLGVRGGWPALYAANRRVIGSDPNALQPGTVLRLPRVGAAPATSGVTPRRHPAPPRAPAPARHRPHPVTKGAAASTGMPQWLKTMLVALGLLILVALLTEPVLAALRRRQKAALEAARRGTGDPAWQMWSPPATPERASIVLADHDRLVVTCSKHDQTVYVLRPPGEDPRAILRLARLVLPEGPYWELAKQLGVPAVEPVE